jgi:hypothetical protein
VCEVRNSVNNPAIYLLSPILCMHAKMRWKTVLVMFLLLYHNTYNLRESDSSLKSQRRSRSDSEEFDRSRSRCLRFLSRSAWESCLYILWTTMLRWWPRYLLRSLSLSRLRLRCWWRLDVVPEPLLDSDVSERHYTHDPSSRILYSSDPCRRARVFESGSISRKEIRM